MAVYELDIPQAWCVHRSTYSNLKVIAPIALAALLWTWGKSLKLFEYRILQTGYIKKI